MAEQRLQKWALVAELVSALAVVVTLAFLIVGMRDNTNAIQAQTYQQLMRDINTWRSSIRDLEREEILFRIDEGDTENLADGELAAVRLAYLELWGIYEAAFFANDRGVLGPNEWTRFEIMICFERTSVSESFFEQDFRGILPISETLTPAFAAYVRESCD